MDFTLNEEQRAMYNGVLRAARERMNDGVFGDDESSSFSRRKWGICAELGILGLPFPKKYGGLEADMLSTAVAVRALAKGCNDEGLIFSICAHMCTCAIPLLLHGTEEQKERYLADIASGGKIGGNGMTEADAGSDVSSIKTSVVKQGDAYSISGCKIFVTNAPVADILLIYARHPNGIRMADVSCFILERGAGGWNLGQVFSKMGLRTSPLGEVVLNECKVPKTNMLGRERLGMRVFNDSMMWERIMMSAYHVGAMERQFESVVEYASTRQQFGRRIVEFQDVSGKIVDMATRIECSRLLLAKACWKYDNGEAHLGDAAMLKLVASESKVKNSMEAIQIFGAYGYMKEHEAEKQMRDSVASTIYSGTTEMQKRIIIDNIERFMS